MTAQESSAVIALRVDSEIRRGRDYVRVIIVSTVDAADVAEALDIAWWAFRNAAGNDLAGWDLASATARGTAGSAVRRLEPRAVGPGARQPVKTLIQLLSARSSRRSASSIALLR